MSALKESIEAFSISNTEKNKTIKKTSQTKKGEINNTNNFEG
jgi:hypothetical protein